MVSMSADCVSIWAVRAAICFGGGGGLEVHLGHAAGENDAEACAQLVAECAVTLGLGGLALERGHLACDFFEDVVDAREILFCGFEAELGEALFRLEAGDAGGLFDDAATVERLGARAAGRCAPGRSWRRIRRRGRCP